MPYAEDQILLKPLSFYAKTKINNEKNARFLLKNNTFKIVGLRFFTVFGPYGRPDMVYYSFTNAIKNNKKITLFNNGALKRDMTYIDDVVDGIELSITFLNKMKSGLEIFNLGNDKPISTNKLVESIQKKLNKKAKVIYVEKIDEAASTTPI